MCGLIKGVQVVELNESSIVGHYAVRSIRLGDKQCGQQKFGVKLGSSVKKILKRKSLKSKTFTNSALHKQQNNPQDVNVVVFLIA